MADEADLEARITRLEAALTATSDALEAVLDAEPAVDHAPALKSAQDDLMEANHRIETLEQAAKDREATLDTALARVAEAEARADAVPAASGGSDDLEAKLAELRALRAQDLSEMKALLAELEPILEQADA